MAETIFLHGYAGRYREIAKDIKNIWNTDAYQIVAAEMAEVIEDGSIVIPAPSSSGRNPAMYYLADEIVGLVPGAKVVEAIVRETPIRSSHESRQLGLPPPSVSEHIESMALAEDVGDEGRIYLIDNVVTSGNTLRAMEAILGEPKDRVVWLAYAKATRSKPIKRNAGKVRYCISGSRTCTNWSLIEDVLLTIPSSPDVVIVHGGAKGVDTIAGEIAEDMGFTVEVWPADWKKYGRAAGPIRNKAMIETCDRLIAFWDGKSRGTLDAIRVADKLGVEYEVIPC